MGETVTDKYNKVVDLIKSEGGLKGFSQKETAKQNAYTIFGHLHLVDDLKFKQFMMFQISQFLTVLMYFEDEKIERTNDKEPSSISIEEVREIVLTTYGKILYFSNNWGHVDYIVTPISQSFEKLIYWLNGKLITDKGD